MKFIGITGGIGAGKSEVLSFIAKHYKCEIYLADKVAFEVRRPGTKAYEALVELLGNEAVNDNALMAKMIYEDNTLLQKVNDIIHPAVKDYLLSAFENAKKKSDIELFFVEAALLIEGGYKAIVDEMWYIHASSEVRVNRLMEARGYSREKALSIMATQLSEEEFRAGSDFVIDNSGSIADAKKQIRARLEEYTWLK